MSILDSIATTQEVIQFTKRNKEPGFMLKLDFEQAYDTVEWDCILESLHSWEFPFTWIPWIRIWMRSAKVLILVNGIHGWEIFCKR